MHHAALDLSFSSPIARSVQAALSPETGNDVPKTSARTTLRNDSVLVEIDADDLPSLRAALNSYLRWADAAERAARIGLG